MRAARLRATAHPVLVAAHACVRWREQRWHIRTTCRLAHIYHYSWRVALAKEHVKWALVVGVALDRDHNLRRSAIVYPDGNSKARAYQIGRFSSHRICAFLQVMQPFLLRWVKRRTRTSSSTSLGIFYSNLLYFPCDRQLRLHSSFDQLSRGSPEEEIAAST